MKKHIPNLFTLLNLLSGCFGVVFSFSGDLRLVSLMILISLFLDYLDGMSARILNVKSDLGKQLDSLADLVSFGLLPGLIGYHLLITTGVSTWSYLAFLITIFSAYRLGKFNIDQRQSVNFIGLPTPANAILWASFPMIVFGTSENVLAVFMSDLVSSRTTIYLCIILFSYLLNAEVMMFSLKFKSLRWQDNSARYIYLLVSLILFVAMGIYSMPFIIILYIIFSIIFHKQVRSYEIQS